MKKILYFLVALSFASSVFAQTASTVNGLNATIGPIAGSGAAIVTGPASSVSGDVLTYTGTAGQTQDSSISLSWLTTPSANIKLLNNQLIADRVTTATNYGYLAFGTSFTCGTGGSGTYNPYPLQIAADLGATLTNHCQSGDTAADGAAKFFTYVNQGDYGNPLITAEWGRNDIFYYGTASAPVFKKCLTAIEVAGSISATNRFLAGNTTYWTQSGTWSADTTYTNYNGLTSSTAASTITGTFQLPQSGVFYILYKMTPTASAGTFNVSAGGTTLTDTVSGGATVSSDWSLDPARNGATSSVGAARYVATPGSTSISINYLSGTTTIFGIWLPATPRNGGTSAPRLFLGDTIPEQNNITAASDLIINSANIATVVQSQADGLFVYAVDLNGAVDPNLDFTSTTTQNCNTSGSNLPVHPNNCGYNHMAQRFESAINPSITVNSYLGPVSATQFKSTFSTAAPTFWNTNSGNAFGTTNPGDGVAYFGTDNSDTYLSVQGFEYDATNSKYATTTNFGTSTEVSWKTCAGGYASTSACTLRAFLDSSGDYTATGYLKGTQIIGSGSAPSIAAGTGAGTGPTVSISGTNLAGVINITTGTSPVVSSIESTITFSGTLTTAPQGCNLTPRNAATALAAAMIYTTAPSTTSWTISDGGTALTASTAYSWSYSCF